MELSIYLSEIESSSSLAEKLGVSVVAVSRWKKGKRFVPAERCIEIEKATDRQVTCEELRPDLDWPFLRQASILTTTIDHSGDA